MSLHFVYTHSIAGKVFYVGQGTLSRTFSRRDRNKIWHRLVELAHGRFEKAILYVSKDKEDALECEARFISQLKPEANIRIPLCRADKQVASKKKMDRGEFTKWLLSK